MGKVHCLLELFALETSRSWVKAVPWEVAHLGLARWELNLFVGLGALVPSAEIGAALMLLWEKYRGMGIVILYVLQVGLAVMTGEWDFALTGFILLGLFHDRWPKVQGVLILVAILVKFVGKLS